MRRRIGIAAGLALAIAAAAQAPVAGGLAEGRLLVADRKLGDPNFARTVILLVDYSETGAMGLILNRQTDVSIAQALKPFKEAEGRNDPVFLGGPVERRGIFGLLRSRDRLKGEMKRVAGVYFVSSRESLQETLGGKPAPDTFRVYVGYAGWGRGQLDSEVALGAWHILRGDAAAVFDADPATLWNRLIGRTEQQVASAHGH